MSAPLHLDRSYFERVYAGDPDPWDFETSAYERDKYDRTLAALPRDRFRRGFEPGCANGALTVRLAERCDELVATEIVRSTAERARTRCRSFDNLTVEEQPFPMWWPPGRGDLVIWSEIAYYCSPAGLDMALDRLDAWLEPGGTLLAVHYTGTTDYPLTARQVHDGIDRASFLERRARHRGEEFEICCWQRRDPGVVGLDSDRRPTKPAVDVSALWTGET